MNGIDESVPAAQGDALLDPESEHRLFVAVPVPPDIAGRLRATLPVDRYIRPTPVTQTHLTLRFIGQTEASQASALRDALGAIRTPAFVMRIGSLGRFGRGGILWAGVEPCPPLMALQAAVEQATVGVGMAAEARPFHPHITVARCRPQAPAPLLRAWAAGPAPALDVPVSRFLLMASVLQPGGAVHRCVAAYPLQGRDNPT